jgi:chromosomal replication initiation ATPase DnaA
MTKSNDILQAFNELNDLDKDEVIVKLLQDYKKKNPLGFIEKTVCDHLKISLHEVKSDSRLQNVVLARHLIMYFARKYTNFSLLAIGRYMGGRDHATVIHAGKKIEKMILDKPEILSLVGKITDELNLAPFSAN